MNPLSSLGKIPILNHSIRPRNTRPLWPRFNQSMSHASHNPVALVGAGVDHPDLSRIGHDDLMPQVLEQPTDPGRVRAHLSRDAGRIDAFKPLVEGLGRGRDSGLLGKLSIAVQHRQLTESSAPVHPHSYLGVRKSGHWANLFFDGPPQRARVPLQNLHRSLPKLGGWPFSSQLGEEPQRENPRPIGPLGSNLRFDPP